MRRYVPGDLAEVTGWYRAHGLTGVEARSLPEIGFIEPGVAAGFLYRTDSDVALLEGFVTNPDAPSEQRSAALDELAVALIEAGRARGARRFVGLCRDEGIAVRAVERHGMHLLGVYLMVLKEV